LDSTSTNIEYIGNGAGSLFNCVQFGKMIVMTYHSVKGLDFDNVFLPFLTNKLYIRDKTLFAVGLTRSKNNLYLSYSGTLHPFLKDLEDECTKIDIANLTVKDNDVLDFDF
jgi:superfamily I DNA/RNA helicase